MTIDVEFAHDAATSEYRNYDFRLGFDGAGEVTRIFAHVIDHHGCPVEAAAPQIPWCSGILVCGVIAP